MTIFLAEPDDFGNTRARDLDDDEIRRIMAPTAAIDAGGFYERRQLADGRWIGVWPLLYQRARLGITLSRGPQIDQAFARGFTDVWDYPNRQQAISALMAWDGEGAPSGGYRPSRNFS
jgi:hypothetical protein